PQGFLHQYPPDAPLEEKRFRLGSAAQIQTRYAFHAPCAAIEGQRVDSFLVTCHRLTGLGIGGLADHRYGHLEASFTLLILYQRIGRAVLRGILFTPKWPVRTNYNRVRKLLIVKTRMLTGVIWSEPIRFDS